jgi:hypothetical protein
MNCDRLDLVLDYDLTGSDFRCDEQNEYQSYSKFKVDKGSFYGRFGHESIKYLGRVKPVPFLGQPEVKSLTRELFMRSSSELAPVSPHRPVTMAIPLGRRRKCLAEPQSLEENVLV